MSAFINESFVVREFKVFAWNLRKDSNKQEQFKSFKKGVSIRFIGHKTSSIISYKYDKKEDENSYFPLIKRFAFRICYFQRQCQKS